MSNTKPVALLGMLLLALPSCMKATVGSTIEVPEDAATTCESHCLSIGMKLSAVAVMANNVGCICQYPGDAGTAARGEAVTAGMATIMLQRQAQEQQEQQQR